jgi:hypothetical protein
MTDLLRQLLVALLEADDVALHAALQTVRTRASAATESLSVPRDNPHAPVITIGEAVGVVEEVTGRPVHYTTIRRWLKAYPALGYQLPSGAWRVFESELRRHLMRGRERPARNEIDAT